MDDWDRRPLRYRYEDRNGLHRINQACIHGNGDQAENAATAKITRLSTAVHKYRAAASWLMEFRHGSPRFRAESDGRNRPLFPSAIMSPSRKLLGT